METPAKSSVVLDVASAVGVNVIAFVVGYPIAMVAPTFLMFIMPFGMFWGYVVLVGLYAFSRYRKGRRRRAFLAGAVALIVLVVLGASIRIG